ncbi:MAG: MerR family transcriptional regulator [Polyangiaceae bacterium]
MNEALTIREVAVSTGTTVHTLRYYERAGLLPKVPRAVNGHRRYGPDEVRLVLFLRKLHETGMPIRHMLTYARLIRRGDSTVAERKAILETHKVEVEARIKTLQESLRLIRKKIDLYAQLERDASHPSESKSAVGRKKST